MSGADTLLSRNPAATAKLLGRVRRKMLNVGLPAVLATLQMTARSAASTLKLKSLG